MSDGLDRFSDPLVIIRRVDTRAVSYKPTEAMREEARQGLEWRKEHGRGGTAVGVARARDISNGRSLPLDTVKRMVSYFARHEIDKQAEGWSPGEDGYPSAGRIAWALWGGDAGRAWAAKIVDNAEERYNPDQPRDENGRWASTATGSVDSGALTKVNAVLKEEALTVAVDNAHLVGDQLTDNQQLKFLTVHSLDARMQDVSTDDLVASTNNRNERACLALARNTTDIYGAMDIYTDGMMAGTGPSQKLRAFVEQSGEEFKYGVVLAGGRAKMVMYRDGDDTLYDPFDTARLGKLEPAISRFDPKVGPEQVHTGEMGVQVVRLSSISQHVQSWAETSNDHNPHSLLAQETAKSVFKLKDTADWDTESVIQEAMDDIAPRVTPVQTRILEEMHGRTQEVLAKNGVKEISVARGMTIDDQDEAPMLSEASATGSYRSEVQMRPMSSWTTNISTAEQFASASDGYPIILRSRVPAEQVLSFAGTGYGCDGESEVVLLGGVMSATVEPYE